jgi:hypothetical protein
LTRSDTVESGTATRDDTEEESAIEFMCDNGEYFERERLSILVEELRASGQNLLYRI